MSEWVYTQEVFAAHSGCAGLLLDILSDRIGRGHSHDLHPDVRQHAQIGADAAQSGL